MSFHFVESTDKPERFFRAIPADWYEGIEPFWNSYKHTARIFTAETDAEVLGGGIVFSTLSPDTHPGYKKQAQEWFNRGYLYIGFLWFSEAQRGRKLGTKWLQHVYQTFPEHKFWLGIDDFHLASFYSRNGFELIEQLDLNEWPEWVMAKHSLDAVLIPMHVPGTSAQFF